jgi:hypothetical protein
MSQRIWTASTSTRPQTTLEGEKKQMFQCVCFLRIPPLKKLKKFLQNFESERSFLTAQTTFFQVPVVPRVLENVICLQKLIISIWGKVTRNLSTIFTLIF